ncbi:MAG: DUF4440 domain-containing protein [Balneolaceae bacterium]|nr:DUF4440 domain-containing protein [Balneolaceae bacterium]
MPAATPEECNNLCETHLNARELDPLVDLYLPDAVHIKEDGSVAAGRDVIRQVHRSLLAMEPELTLLQTEVVPVGEDLAIIYDEWELSGRDPEGKEFEMEGAGTHLVRHTGDGWLFAATGLGNR